MKTWIKILIAVIVLVLIVAALTLAFGSVSTGNAIFGGDSVKSFVKCLNDKQVSLFVFDGNLQARAQLKMFGESVSDLKVIDCGVTPEKCIGVMVYPSWGIDGRIVSSGLSLGTLSQLSGCRIE